MSKTRKRLILLGIILILILICTILIIYAVRKERGTKFHGNWYNDDNTVYFSCSYCNGDITFSFHKDNEFRLYGPCSYDKHSIYATNMNTETDIRDFEIEYVFKGDTLDLTYNGREYSLRQHRTTTA